MISVIINVYNGEKYIKKCLDCIVNQTYKDLEILIVNDGSTDNTLAICETYKDKRIKIINQKNMGLALSRNVGIDNATGDYLYFIDVDDLIELNTLEYLYNLSKKHNTPIATCNSLRIYDYKFTTKKYREKVNMISSKEMIRKILFFEDYALSLWNKLIKRELFNNIRFEDRIADDVVVTYKLAIAAGKIAYSNQIKYYYLKREGSLCAIKKEDYDSSIDFYNASFERYNYIKNLYHDFTENDVGMLYVIARFYLKENEEIRKFLDEQGAIKLFNNLFSPKVFSIKMKSREKIKLILFRINPKLHNFVINFYLKLKRKIK